MYYNAPNSFMLFSRISNNLSLSRVLIAYEDGLIIIWDVSEDKVVLVKGNKDLELKCKITADSHKDTGPELSDDISDYQPLEKEIAALCWASTDGSVLAVGYVDGDILLWNLSSTTSAKDMHAAKSSNDVVKLLLSTGDRRLPVIVLHWSAHRSHNDCRGRLFVYGGDAIGSEEALTVCFLTRINFLQFSFFLSYLISHTNR